MKLIAYRSRCRYDDHTTASDPAVTRVAARVVIMDEKGVSGLTAPACLVCAERLSLGYKQLGLNIRVEVIK